MGNRIMENKGVCLIPLLVFFMVIPTPVKCMDTDPRHREQTVQLFETLRPYLNVPKHSRYYIPAYQGKRNKRIPFFVQPISIPIGARRIQENAVKRIHETKRIACDRGRDRKCRYLMAFL